MSSYQTDALNSHVSLSLYPSMSLTHLRSLSGISSVSCPLSQLLYLTPLQGAQCKFQRPLWWICLNVGTQPSAWIITAPAHQECVKCWPSSHIGVQNALTVILLSFSLVLLTIIFRAAVKVLPKTITNNAMLLLLPVLPQLILQRILHCCYFPSDENSK